MADKEKKLTEELQKCRDNIQRTKDLIAYHRDILRKQERKADEIAAKLDKEKMKSLLGMIHDGGLDIDSLRNAVSSGQISANAETDKTTQTICIAYEPAGYLSNEEIGYFMEGAFEVLNRIPEADMKEYAVYSYHFCTYEEYMDEIYPEHIRETGLLTNRAVHLASVPQSRYYTDDGIMIECGYDVIYDMNSDRIMLMYYIITANRAFTTI